MFSYSAGVKAAIYQEFRQPIRIEELPDPVPAPDGVVVQVRANGVCRSDWHGWMGHDADITPPHVPGHELAGVIVAVGADVRDWREGDRVTTPFVCGCGTCVDCANGDHQVCARQEQPGFTHWGSFAELVALRYADTNLVRLPEDLGFVTAAALGCRFATSFRAVIQHARAREGEWLVVHGCGGVGLSAVMIGEAVGARVLAVDVDDEKLSLASSLGAEYLLRADQAPDVAVAVQQITQGGAHASIDALGSATTCRDSILGLRRRGRHVQVGLMVGDEQAPPLPMARAIAWELEILGSHGMSARHYPVMLDMIEKGTLDPARLVGRKVSLEAGTQLLQSGAAFADPGVVVINQF